MADLVPVITIDGPGGVGKGTLAYWVANKLGWSLLDSGLIYRYFAWLASADSVSIDDQTNLRLTRIKATGRFVLGDVQVRLEHQGNDITDLLRTEDVAKAASQYSASPFVRALLVDMQRQQASSPGLVADGRDMGTVIFPDASIKIFLTASAQVRAKRRFKQLKDKGLDANLAALSRDIEARDHADRNRSVSPLKPAKDAVIIDTSMMSIEAVCTTVWQLIQSHPDIDT